MTNGNPLRLLPGGFDGILTAPVCNGSAWFTGG